MPLKAPVVAVTAANEEAPDVVIDPAVKATEVVIAAVVFIVVAPLTVWLVGIEATITSRRAFKVELAPLASLISIFEAETSVSIESSLAESVVKAAADPVLLRADVISEAAKAAALT